MRKIAWIAAGLAFAAQAWAADMDFGAIEFVPGSSTLNATMDVSSGALYCLNPGYSCPRFGTRGSYLLTGRTGSMVSISCDSKATISNGLTNLAINNVFLMINNIPSMCLSLNTPAMVHVLSGIQANNMLYLAGKLFVPGGVPEAKLKGKYSTSNAGGEPLTVRLIYY